MRQGGACKLHLANTWDKHGYHMVIKFLSKKDTNRLYGDAMCLCSFCGGKHAFEEEIRSFSEGHEVCMYSSGHSTYLKKQKKKEMPHQSRRRD